MWVLHSNIFILAAVKMRRNTFMFDVQTGRNKIHCKVSMEDEYGNQ